MAHNKDTEAKTPTANYKEISSPKLPQEPLNIR